MPILAFVMLVLTAWTGMAHAAENLACVEVPAAEATLHVAGDGDQVPADEEKGYPHHHAGCHGHHVATAAEDALVTGAAMGAETFIAVGPHALLARTTDQAPRPPQA